MKLNSSLTMAFAAGIAVAGIVVAQTTVFEVPAGADNFYSTALEYGDQITLAPGGGAWTLSSISFPYYANYAQTGGLVFSIYQNDGIGGAPGSSLYSSAPIDVLNNGGTVTISFPDVAANVLPGNTFTYSVSFNGVGSGQVAGLIVPDKVPTVGTSLNDYWEKGGSGWELRQITGGDLANFQITVTAVPEPGPVALAGAGLAGLIGMAAYRRFQKR